MTGAAHHRGASKQDYATPAEFIAAVERRWGKLDFDLAASPENAKAFSYLTEKEDSLSFDWTRTVTASRRWLNPPFGNIAPWARKCAETIAVENAMMLTTSSTRRIFFLTPASIGSNWFGDYVFGKALVVAIGGRLSFDGKNPFPKDCMLSVYGEPPGFVFWRWK